MLNIEIPPSAPVTKEEREKWLAKAEYGGKTRRLIDHLDRVIAERNAFIKYLVDEGICLFSECPKEQDNITPLPCYECCLEWARKEAGRKNED